MKHTFILVFIILFESPIQSQIFKLDFFDAERQSQVDSFLIKYPDVRYITQKLTIRKNVTNLHGLKKIREIANFEIKDKSILQNFVGLENLEMCGSLIVQKNQNKLVDFTGLNKLIECDRIGIGGSLTVQSLDGLENLKKIGNGISLEDCPRLRNIKALSNVDTISFDFVDAGGGGSGIFEKYSQIYVRNCDSLETLEGLENVVSFTFLVLQDNAMLKDISAISKANFLKYPSRQSLYISRNKNLSICNHPNICDYIQTVPRQVVFLLGTDKVYNIDIFDNAEACKDYQTLLDVCLVPTEEQQLLHEVEIFPNPGAHFLEIKLNADLELNVDIFDSQGKVVAQGQSNYIDTEHLPQGFYFVRIKHKESNATTTKKWIKI